MGCEPALQINTSFFALFTNLMAQPEDGKMERKLTKWPQDEHDVFEICFIH